MRKIKMKKNEKINYNLIDTLIKEAIKKLNKNSVITEFSCQGHAEKGEIAYIIFYWKVEIPKAFFITMDKYGFFPSKVSDSANFKKKKIAFYSLLNYKHYCYCDLNILSTSIAKIRQMNKLFVKALQEYGQL